MSKRRQRRQRGEGPRRPDRLLRGRDWIQSGAQVSVVAYARRFGTDRYTGYDELTALGWRVPASARRYATRPVPVKRPPKPAAKEPRGLPDGWIEFCGDVLMPVGWTEGGFPHGPSWEDVFGDGGDRAPERPDFEGPDSEGLADAGGQDAARNAPRDGHVAGNA